MSTKNKNTDDKSELNVLIDNKLLSIIKGEKIVDEEFVIQGSVKGLKIKYFHSENGKAEKITITGNNGDYTMKIQKDGKIEEKVLNTTDLKKELNKSKLKFAKDVINLDSKK